MNLLYTAHSFIRKYLSVIERLGVGAALTALVYLFLQALPVYPEYWDIVIIGAVFFLSLWMPVLGYFVTLVALAYPLYTISIYLAVVFLAVTIIGQHLFARNMGGSLLTVFAPTLSGFYLPWIIPLLGGLWWGPAGGALMGGCAALFGQILFGISGLDPDWVGMLGYVPDTSLVARHFTNANSWQTLTNLFSPLAPNSTRLLYNLLQVVIWALVGWGVGMLAGKESIQYRKPRSTMLLAVGGAFVLMVLHMALSLWLTPVIQPNYWVPLALTALCSGLLVLFLEALQDFFEHPLPLRSTKSSTPAQINSHPMPPAPQQVPDLPKMDEKDKPDDIIMLELD